MDMVLLTFYRRTNQRQLCSHELEFPKLVMETLPFVKNLQLCKHCYRCFVLTPETLRCGQTVHYMAHTCMHDVYVFLTYIQMDTTSYLLQ